MSVIIEYYGRLLGWSICTVEGEVLLDSFGPERDARNWVFNRGWEVVQTNTK